MSYETLKNVLLVGSGGREHATANAFLNSDAIHTLFVAPGNDGIFNDRKDKDPRLEKVDLKVETLDDIYRLATIAKKLHTDLVFVGPEKPLSLGIVDVFEKEGLAIVGPSKKASQLEGSKAWAKDIMKELGIPIPEYAHFDDSVKAEEYIRTRDYPVVVKADGLAAGKGSIVTNSRPEALDALKRIMIDKEFKEAGDTVVIERRLDGNEFSFFAFTDGETVRPLAWARDYKPVDDYDQGLNTGGMGGFSPYRENEPELTQEVMRRITVPLINGCRERYKFAYKGILYIGGTFVNEGDKLNPYVFEINVRMGDPEAQVIYPRLKTDMMQISMAIVQGSLGQLGKFDWNPNYHVGICATSGRSHGSKGWYPGYPRRYAIGKPITGLDNISSDTLVFHSGTKWDPVKNQFITDGGRVLTVVANDPTLEGARTKAYREMEKINFEGIHYRTDIGKQK